MDKKTLEKLISLRDDFVEDFGIAKIEQMQLDEYVIGKQNENTYCYRLEYQLKELGNNGGANASKYGVWYGKFGNAVSKEIINEQLESDDPKFLLIKSGGIDRYWVHFDKYVQDTPEVDKIPEYYRNNAKDIKCWFRITRFEKADKDVLSKCSVLSSGDCLSTASKHSMNPYFKIDYRGENNE